MADVAVGEKCMLPSTMLRFQTATPVTIALETTNTKKTRYRIIFRKLNIVKPFNGLNSF